MLALIAGRGDLPAAVAGAQRTPPIVCALEGTEPEALDVDMRFRLERIGGFLARLRRRGVSRVCLAGGIDRPRFHPARLDMRTVLYIPRILRALRKGDDGALRTALALFEGAGFQIVGAHQAAPDLLPPAGVPTRTAPDAAARSDAAAGDRAVAEMGRRDLGQACILRHGAVLAREDATGTDAMLAAAGPDARGGLLYKAPKPDQDRRVDLPTIGPATAAGAVAAGLRGIVIEAGGVILLHPADVMRQLDAAGVFLWVREKPA